jgi:hypothetical protein
MSPSEVMFYISFQQGKLITYPRIVAYIYAAPYLLEIWRERKSRSLSIYIYIL